MMNGRLKWDWTVPPSHEGQPLVEWWVEQVIIHAILKICMRAHRRGDKKTFVRMGNIIDGGAAAEIGTGLW